MTKSSVPIYEREPWCFLHRKQKFANDRLMRHRLRPYILLMKTLLGMASENASFEMPNVDFAWFVQMNQLISANVFGGGYKGFPSPIDFERHSSNLLFANMSSLFNHSCTPNIASNSEREKVASFWYVASRPIAKGESLRISYLESTTKDDLLKNYGFECDCELCCAI